MDLLNTIPTMLFTGKCPNCGEVVGQFPWYIRPENREAGIFCPNCDAHFFDRATCSQQFDSDDSDLDNF